MMVGPIHYDTPVSMVMVSNVTAGYGTMEQALDSRKYWTKARQQRLINSYTIEYVYNGTPKLGHCPLSQCIQSNLYDSLN